MITFTKMHGLGNDFIVVNAVTEQFQPTSEQICRLADRHTGIGFDQLLIIEPTTEPGADFFYRIFNADGSEAAQCGNGARCIARFIHEKGLCSRDHITVATRAGRLELFLQPGGLVKVNMGIPQLKASTRLETSVVSVEAGIVSMGNAHGVIQMDDVIQVPVPLYGSHLTHAHPDFSEGLNVGFMQVLSPNRIALRVYERGVGETLGCGSGACAAVAVGRSLGVLNSQVQVDLPGGELQIEWVSEDAPLWMTGPAVTVFEGQIMQTMLQ